MLKNFSALVTGGAQGIGKALADSILQYGGKVAILDIDSGKGFEVVSYFRKTYGEKNSIYIHCDVTDPSSLREAFNHTYDCFNGINLLVNNAGVATLKEEDWRRTLEVNLVSLVDCCYLGKELMMKSSNESNKHFQIVNIASAGGLIGMAVDPVYSASKHGVVGLSRSLADRWLPLKIRVNCLCPMFVDTELFRIAAKVNTEYAETLKTMPFLNVAEIVKVFNDLLDENDTTGEVIHISSKGAKKINKMTLKIPVT